MRRCDRRSPRDSCGVCGAGNGIDTNSAQLHLGSRPRNVDKVSGGNTVEDSDIAVARAPFRSAKGTFRKDVFVHRHLKIVGGGDISDNHDFFDESECRDLVSNIWFRTIG